MPRAPMNVPMLRDNVCTIAPANMITDPMNSVGRLPRLSDTSGVKGNACAIVKHYLERRHSQYSPRWNQ